MKIGGYKNGPAIVFLSFIYGLLAFPLFYFVYKFGDPEPLAHDFFQYYRLYKDWAIDNTNAPFNMRLVGSFIVHLFYQGGLHYDTITVFDKYQGWGFERDVFFCAVFFNYLCVVATGVYLFFILRRISSQPLLAFTGGLFYLLGFGTLFYELMPLTDACSVLLFTVTLHFYLRGSYYALIPLILLLFQREYVFLALGLMALMDYFPERKRYYLHVLFSCVVLMIGFIVLRKTIFYTSALDFQLSLSFVWKTMTGQPFPWLTYLKQLVMTLNIFIIYLAVVTYKWSRSLSIHRFELLKMVLLFLQVNLLSYAWALGTNVGRYFYIIVPVVIVSLVKEINGMGNFTGLLNTSGNVSESPENTKF